MKKILLVILYAVLLLVSAVLLIIDELFRMASPCDIVTAVTKILQVVIITAKPQVGVISCNYCWSS